LKALRFVFLFAALLGIGLARPRVYSMGPVHRFDPVAGDEVNTISFANGISIDTRTSGPALPPGLSAAETPGQAQYYIIQFSGPIRAQWFDELKRVGVDAFGYLPNYAVLANLTSEHRSAVAGLPMVRWTGLFQPAYKLQQELLDASGPHKLVILLMPGETETAVTDAVAALGGTVDETMTSDFGTTITVSVDGGDIPALARVSSVAWIQEWTQGSFCNNTSQWVMQGGYRGTAPPDTSMAARPVWRNGVRGQRVILSVTDTGLNTGHNMFRDPSLSITPPGIWPDHRKVVAFKLFQGATATEYTYHGSHVQGSVAGDDSVTNGTSYYDGMAPKARLYFVDIESGSGNFVVPTDHTPLWDTVYQGRGLPDSLKPIKQQSGSWGWSNSSGTYLTQDASTDAFCWKHKDYMCLMAAGNEYSARRLRNPGIAKNVLTIGATERGTSSNVIANFSSRGPTQDGRIKPNVMAPGVDIMSAQSSGQSGYSAMSGTSMATPTANGTVGLMRCYLQEGYYPTGAPVPGNRFTYVSSALLRSMAMASADPNVGSYTIPSTDIGWGRIDADSVLYFTGDTRKLLLIDDTSGVATGEYKETQFLVHSALPLRVCLAWTDSAAAANANPTLVNDLDLTLTSPAGTVYKGNKYTSGQSTQNPAGRDSTNVEECARINAPDTGLWTMRVAGRNVRTAHQPFAWTVTGNVETYVLAHDVGATAIIAPVDSVDSGETVAPQAVVENFGSSPETFVVRFTIADGYWDTTSVTLAAGAVDTVRFEDWTANTLGTFATNCSTELAADQDRSNDAAAGSVRVVPFTGIAEQSRLPAVFSLDKAVPNPTSGAATIRFGLPRAAHVSLAVYSAAGTRVATLANSAFAPGYHNINCKLQTANCKLLSSGIYLVRLEAGDHTATRKLVVQR
jgi:hypothetical protein